MNLEEVFECFIMHWVSYDVPLSTIIQLMADGTKPSPEPKLDLLSWIEVVMCHSPEGNFA